MAAHCKAWEDLQEIFDVIVGKGPLLLQQVRSFGPEWKQHVVRSATARYKSRKPGATAPGLRIDYKLASEGGEGVHDDSCPDDSRIDCLTVSANAGQHASTTQ